MAEKFIRLIQQASVLLFISFLVACAAVKDDDVWDPLTETSEPASRGIERSTHNLSPAIAALINKADMAIERQQWQRAVASLERALRINGKQPEVWTRMAVVYLGQYNPQQAIHMAKRSNSYARTNNELRAYNWLLISRAYTLMQRHELADEAAMKSQQLQQANH